MAQPALKYYVTSEWPERVEELRSNISTAADAPALLSAAYAAGRPAGVDFWAAASIDYPSATIWFHTRQPLAAELLEQQAAELNRQVGLVRSDDTQLPVMSFRPEPMATAVEADAPPFTEALAHYRDFIVFSAAQPQALVRAGALGPDSTPDYQQIAPLAELVGLNLAAIQRQSGSLETAQLIASRQEWSEEQFFDLLERALANVHQREEELSVLAMQVEIEYTAGALAEALEPWEQVWHVIRDNLRSTDVVCQLQPGYYVIAMLGTSPRQAMVAADRLRTWFRLLSKATVAQFTTTMGISHWSTGRPGIGQLLWQARQAMEMAAASGAESPFVYT